jgi:putative hydrolase of the HAD superfamily
MFFDRDRYMSRATSGIAITAIALDAMGVIYAAADDVVELLIPFALAAGCTLDSGQIEALYTEASLGRMTDEDLWTSLGIAEPAWPIGGLSETYLRQHRLNPGLFELLDRCDEAGISVGCISNDLASWSTWLRHEHRLSDRIGPWIISAEVGCRKPHRLMYESFLRAAGVSPARCLMVDDREANLDGAASVGLHGLRFAQTGRASKYPTASHLPSVMDVLPG